MLKRRKHKKEALDVIVQRITNDSEGIFLADMLKIANCVKAAKNKPLQDAFEGAKCQEVLREDVKWIYGYENDARNALETIKEQLKKRVFSKEASYVTIISAMACYCVLLSIFEDDFNIRKWYKAFEGCEGKRLNECLEVLRKHCPGKIDVESFLEARRYIRLWDSAFNW